MAAALLLGVTAEAQTRDPNNKYLVWTNNIIFTEEKAEEVPEEKEKADDQTTAVSFIQKNFPYQSMCDWKEGMRFMVIPDKKDMVIRTFCDSTGSMVSSMSLRHKILVYKGHSGENELHERVNFEDEADGTPYYFELPTNKFDDYCFTKHGVPTLAYLGDVDIAIDLLVGKRLITKRKTYNVDVSTTSYGYEKIELPEPIEVTVVAAGVGTRNYPVKLIVQDDEGREFFQNVALSRTNSGMSDHEFTEDDVVKHTFEGSFEMLADKMAHDQQYRKYIGMRVFTLRRLELENEKGNIEAIPRLTGFTVVGATGVGGTEYVRMTFEKDGKKYKKKVSFLNDGKDYKDNNGNDLSDDDYFYHLFASGNVGTIEGVKQEHLADIRRSIVHSGFNETEVKLALGEPDTKVHNNKGEYMWVYSSGISGNNCTVIFNSSTKKVKYVK
ncbi:MAG: hypothetical protein J6I52_11960 [Prevotella sp.]|nr:hypothetical protein [Prevotella sp.]